MTDNDDKLGDDVDILKLTKKLKIRSRDKSSEEPVSTETEATQMEEDSADEWSYFAAFCGKSDNSLWLERANLIPFWNF